MRLKILGATFVLACIASIVLTPSDTTPDDPYLLLQHFIEGDFEAVDGSKSLSKFAQLDTLPEPLSLLTKLEHYLHQPDTRLQLRAILALTTVVLEYRVRLATSSNWLPVQARVRRLIPVLAERCSTTLLLSARSCLPTLLDLLLCIESPSVDETEAVAGALNVGLQSQDEPLVIIALHLSEIFQARYGEKP